MAAEMFDTLAPGGRILPRGVVNLWLFGPVVQKQLEGASTNAMLRTTTALTIINAGNKENVLPGRAEAGEFPYPARRHQGRCAGTHALKVEIFKQQFELFALPGAVRQVAPTDSASTKHNRTVREVFPDALVAPGLMVAAPIPFTTAPSVITSSSSLRCAPIPMT